MEIEMCRYSAHEQNRAKLDDIYTKACAFSNAKVEKGRIFLDDNGYLHSRPFASRF